jgi:tetratricopeptide (TPR) repeat protein
MKMAMAQTGRQQRQNLVDIDFLVLIALVLAVFIVYAKVISFAFINYDDNRYITNNIHVYSGISWQNICWAFNNDVDYWIPLSWLSHMLDCTFFGLNSGLHHLENLLIHIVNSVLLLLLLKKMTGSLLKSAFVAALFGLHPIHVESVAWVAERKDLLSAFFGLMTIWKYTDYIRRRTVTNYLIVVLLFCLGLMAKPMIVTLPIVLLLLDFWPLNQVMVCGHSSNHDDRQMLRPLAFQVRNTILPKIPLLALSGMVSLITIVSRDDSIEASSITYPLSIRVGNAFVSYVTYLRKFFWPSDLAIYYPYPDSIPAGHIVLALLLLVALSVLAIRAHGKYPYCMVGWFWYLIALVPVLGIVNSGSQALADRYTYIPLIGVGIVLAWGGSDLAAALRVGRKVLCYLAIAIVGSYSICSALQVRYWANSTVLFRHALAVTSNNHVAHVNLGMSYESQGDINGALQHYREAVTIRPDWNIALYNYANVLSGIGKYDEAIRYYQRAAELSPKGSQVLYNLGIAYYETGDLPAAERCFQQTIQINPDFVDAYFNLGVIAQKAGKFEKAISLFEQTLTKMPSYARAHTKLGEIFVATGNPSAAIVQFTQALRLDPNEEEATSNLGKLSGATAPDRESPVLGNPGT